MSVRRNIVIAFIFILVGSLVYVLFRQNIILFNLIGTEDFWNSIRIAPPKNDVFLQYFFLYCLSDVLWYSALLILAATFYVRESRFSKFLLAIMILMPFLFEILQFVGMFPGTFDWYDILFYCLTLIIFVLLLIRKSNCLLSHN